MKNTVALSDRILNVLKPKPFNDKDITDLSVLELYVASIKHLTQIQKITLVPILKN